LARYLDQVRRTRRNLLFNDIGRANTAKTRRRQVRRVTRLTKKSSRAAPWKKDAPSGICLTKLVECRCSNPAAMMRRYMKPEGDQDRLAESLQIEHPS
jgi:hypothetical protein